MRRILLTGGSGFLGGNFCRFYSEQFEIHAIWLEHPVQFDHIISQQLNICDAEVLGDYFKKIKPNIVLHFGAYSNPNKCQTHPDISEKINIEASENIAKLSAEMRIPLVFTSTDLVFDGKSAPYKESDIPCPISIYGLHKSIAEQSVLDIYPNATICRLPLMYGSNPFSDLSNDIHGSSFLQQIIKTLSEGKEIKLFTDEFRTVGSVRDVCKGVLLCLEKPGEIFHLGGDSRISRYDFGKLVCEVFGYDKKLLIKAKRKDVIMPAPRPKDVSLSNEKAKKIGWNPGSIKDELEQVKEMMK